MVKSYFFGSNCILLSQPLDNDLVLELCSHIKECDSNAINVLNELGPEKKYNSSIIYTRDDIVSNHGNVPLSTILNEGATVLFLIKTRESISSKDNNFLESLLESMSYTLFSFNFLLVERLEEIKALNLLPFIKWLTDEKNEVSNLIFTMESEVHGKGRIKSHKCVGKQLSLKRQINNPLANMLANMVKIDSGSSQVEFSNSQEDNLFLPVVATGYKSKKFHFLYGPLNSILYSLGIGVSVTHDNGLKFLYENHEEFSIHPGFAVIPSLECLMSVINGQVPNLAFNMSEVLHGEQYTEVISPLPTIGTNLVSQFKIIDILDKGKTGAIILINVDTICQNSGEKMITNQFSILVLGRGGFGGARASPHVIKIISKPNDVDPEFIIDLKTTPDQGALYRLNGDRNPLHIDPKSANSVGFQTPILHGLCTQGIALTAVMNSYGKEKSESISSIKTRFSKPVIPGQTISTHMWRCPDDIQTIIFSCNIKETGDECAIGWVKLNDI